ncbi:HalOD1 output domain-containing protein [Halobacterium yunchengense]|uniref:HalOD1 output domain-containing protein n=1 Tax=Halobacterium yunchengense TaxID=3108497 RepID=UPI00300929D6
MSHDSNDAADREPTERRPTLDAEPATVRYDWRESGQPSVTVSEAVAAATGRLTTDLPPLQQSVDPDALDTLLTRGQSAVTVSFTYADVTVSVNGAGTVEVAVAE